jgi:hypothetical protein
MNTANMCTQSRLSLSFGGDGDGGRYDLERCQALVPSPQTCFLSGTASGFETCRSARTRSSPRLRRRLLGGRAPAAERGPRRSTAATSGRSLTCRGVARPSASTCTSENSTAANGLARGGSSPNGCHTSSLRTLGGRRDSTLSSAFWPLRWQTSSELWVHIPAAFLKDGFSPDEVRESRSESRSLGGGAQTSRLDFLALQT